MRRGVRQGVLLLSIGLSGCSLDEVSLEGKRCPCAVGWVCDTSTNRCVEELVPGMDAGTVRDGGALDAGRDARSIDARVPDAPRGDPAVPIDAGRRTVCEDAVAASAYFCDGFEDGPEFAAWARGMYATDGEASVSAEAYRGDGALSVTTSVAAGSAAVATTFEPIAEGDLWFRAYYYLPSGWTTYHLDIASVRDLSAPFEGVALALGSSEGPFVYVDAEATAYHGSVEMPRDVWTCIEFHLAVSDDAGSAELFLDGTRIGSSPLDIDTLPPGGLGYLDVGVPYTDEGQEPVTIRVDDVAVGPARIPCDP